MHPWVRIFSFLSALTLAVVLGAGVATAKQPDGDAFVPMRANAQHSQRPGGGGQTNLLSSRGGNVQTATKVYISYWGPEWGTGFSTGGRASSAAQTYVEGFFGNVGGSDWINTDTQYCQGVAYGTTSCTNVASALHAGNATVLFGGSWNDPTAVPTKPTQSQIAAAAVRLRNHFPSADPAQSTFMVFTPHGKSMSGFGTQWCAWHSSSGNLAYAYIPYMPDAGASCGMNFVNQSTGYFDGFSIVAGHEYAEAQTDPYPNSGWLDRNGEESADKCAWSSLSGDITLGGLPYAVQPLWSNKAGGCVAVPAV